MEKKRRGTGRPPGRPRGVTVPHIRHLRLSSEDLATLRVLGERWGVSESETFRRALRETARREGVE